MAQEVKNPPARQETWVRSLSWEDPLRREWLLTPVLFPGEFTDFFFFFVKGTAYLFSCSIS